MASFSTRQQIGARGPSSLVRRLDPADQWLSFALSQSARAAPHPSPESLVESASRTPLRLRLAHLESLPLFQAEDCNFEIRVGVTLFDSGAGSDCFFGNTLYSPPVAYDMRKSRGKRGFHVDLNADVFLHSRAALSGELCAVVEVVLVRRSEEGVVEAEYSAGWAQFPLQLHHHQGQPALGAASGGGASGGSAPASPVRSASKRGATAAAAAGDLLFVWPRGMCSVPVFVGSPRYLVLKRVFPEQTYPPQQLMADGAECRLNYTFEVCPEMEAWLPLVPDNFLLSYHDVVPGLQRLDAASGLPTHRFLGVNSLLLEARLCSVHAVLLCGLQLQLPNGFLEVVRKALLLPPGSPRPSVHGGYAGSPVRLALPLRELQQCLRVRATVHNGRTFVGPTVWAKPAGLEALDGHRGEHCLVVGEDVALAWIPGDDCVAVVLELVLLSATANPEDPGSSDCTVLAWGPLTPFLRISGDGHALVAEGQKQVAMRSGPGHWVRHAPVLDWRRLLERTNRISPDPPLACCVLREVPGRGAWPPPLVPKSLSVPRVPSFRQKSESIQQVQLPSRQSTLPSNPRHSRVPSAQPALLAVEAQGLHPGSTELSSSDDRCILQGQPSAVSVASEAETLCTVQGGTSGREAERKGKKSQAANVAAYKTLARAETINLWQINAHYDQQPPQLQRPSPATWESPLPAVLPPVKTRVATVQRTKGDEKVLFAGSPTARYASSMSAAMVSAPAADQASSIDCQDSKCWCPGSRGRMSVGWGDVVALAATAAPISHSLSRHINMGAEVSDPLDTDEITLQFLGYTPAHGMAIDSLGVRSDGRDTVLTAAPDGGGGCMHFTFRLFSNAPTVTAAARPQLLQGDKARLCGLVPAAAAGELGGRAGPGGAVGVSVTLLLYPLELLEQQLGWLAAQGLGGECLGTAVRQLRLRGARYLADRWLQVDVWDSTSLLQVGTFSLPLRGLLRQGQELAEVVHECPLHDQAQMVERDAQPATLASAPLRGSIIVRLLNRGRQGGLPQMATAGQPAPPAKQQQEVVVVRAKPALDEAGQIACDLAGLELGSASPRTLKEEIIQKAQQKVQRILHYRHVSAGAAEGEGGDRDADVGRLVHDQLLADIEQARDRCKPDVIMRKLQQELPANVAICSGPGEAVGFEREFVNPSHEEGLFEVSSSSPGELSLACDGQEWLALSEAFADAGLLSPAGDSVSRHVITSSRFRLGPRQRAVLRFKWKSFAQGQPPESARMIDVRINRASQDSSSNAVTAATTSHALQRGSERSPQSPNPRFPAAQHFIRQQQEQAASRAGCQGTLVCFKVVVLPQPPVLDRTLRLYHAAWPGQGTASHTVLFSRLPASEKLVCGSLRLACDSGLSAAIVKGPSSHQPAGLLLSYPLPPAGSSLCCQLIAFGGGAAPRPLETWEVYVHSLPCLDMSAVVGETVSIDKLVEAAAEESLQLSCHGLCRDELQFSPSELDVSPGAQGRVRLSYTPQAPSRREALVTIVDNARQRPIDLMIVRLDSTATRISRTFEVTVERGKSVSKKVSYTNPCQQSKVFSLRTTQPGLLRFAKSEMEVAAGATVQVRMTFDASGADTRTQDLLVFVDDLAQQRVEECFRVVLRIT